MDPIVPTKIDTKRLVLRMFQEKDWSDLHEMFSDEECVRYTIKNPLENWQTWRALAAYLGHWQLRGYGPYALEEKATGKVLGACGLWYPGEWPEPEIKWSLSKAYWKQGFAQEAALAVKAMASNMLHTKRLISLIFKGNTASINLAKKIGGHYEKTISFRGGEAEIYAYDLSCSCS